VYPERKTKGFHEAEYLSQFFDTIELNTSFYAPIRPENAKVWIEKVAANPRFAFTAKLWQRFTHELLPPAKPATAVDEEQVRTGFDVLRAAGKLGAVLLQFPFSFHRTAATMKYLAGLLKRFADYPLVIEVRHATWSVPEVFEMLRERSVGFCNIDQPLIGRSLAPSAETTAPVGYVRLHGRRYDTWFTDDEEVPRHERYNYLYTEKELRPWVERVKRVAEDARDVYVITNNHYQGKAVVNALELIAILSAAKVSVPEPLREKFPELERIAKEPAESPRLF